MPNVQENFKDKQKIRVIGSFGQAEKTRVITVKKSYFSQ